MQLADIMSVAKIKMMYASTQRAHSEPGAHSYDAAVHLTGDQWQCPFYMELNQLHYRFYKQATQINGFVLKEKKSIYCIAGLCRDQLEHLASPMTMTMTMTMRQIRVQLRTSPRQVRDDRNMSRAYSPSSVWCYGTISGVPINSAIPLGASSKRAASDHGWLASFKDAILSVSSWLWLFPILQQPRSLSSVYGRPAR